jgi:post-segregation antitoxin (ccd killing protein)
MTLYSEFIGFKISKTQKQTLDKLKGYNVNVSQFVRNAIKEKIERDYDDLKEKSKKEYCPF